MKHRYAVTVYVDTDQDNEKLVEARVAGALALGDKHLKTLGMHATVKGVRASSPQLEAARGKSPDGKTCPVCHQVAMSGDVCGNCGAS